MLVNVGKDPHPLSGAHVMILLQVGVTKYQLLCDCQVNDVIGACLHDILMI